MLNWPVGIQGGGGQYINATITRLIIICRLIHNNIPPSLCFYRSFFFFFLCVHLYILSLVKHFQYGRRVGLGHMPSGGGGDQVPVLFVSAKLSV